MTKLEMYKLLWQDDPYNHPAWESFAKEMSTAQYGTEALNTAWYFFRKGWESNA